MKKLITILVLSLTLAQMALSQTRQLKVLDTNWKFQKGDFEDALK
jgi:beta-galactosidase